MKIKNAIIGSLFIFLITTLSVMAEEQNFRLRLNQLEKAYTLDDIEAEIAFGKDLAAKILKKHPLSKNKRLQKYISLLGAGIVGQIGRPELSYHFAILDLDDVNAYACPGGFIFITSGAIKAMENEAQLVGVLSHEVIHVNQRHIVKQLKIRAKGDGITEGLSNLIGSSTASARILLTQLTEKAYALLFEEGVSKNDEFEADGLGSEGLVSLGYDWTSYQSYLTIIKAQMQKGHGDVLSKTHPDIDDRIERIDKLASELAFNEMKGKRNAKRFKKYHNLL